MMKTNWLPKKRKAEETLYSSFNHSYNNVDLIETDDEVRIVAEIPGMKKEDIEAFIDGDLLIIHGEKKEYTAPTWRKKQAELHYGRFSRTMTLPPNVDRTCIQAKFKRGVLSIALKKSEKAVDHKRRIDIANNT
jgi:HSP20 family protein